MTEQPQHPYEEEGYEVLCDAGNQPHADLLLDELHAAGIRAIQYPSAQETSWQFPPSETSTGIRILVPQDSLTEAKRIYEQLEAGQ